MLLEASNWTYKSPSVLFTMVSILVGPFETTADNVKKAQAGSISSFNVIHKNEKATLYVETSSATSPSYILNSFHYRPSSILLFPSWNRLGRSSTRHDDGFLNLPTMYIAGKIGHVGRWIRSNLQTSDGVEFLLPSVARRTAIALL